MAKRKNDKSELIKDYDLNTEMSDTPQYMEEVFSSFGRLMVKTVRLAYDIERIQYDMTNVKAIDTTREKGTYNENAAAERFLNYSDELERKEKEFECNKKMLETFQTMCNWLPNTKVKEHIYNKYIKNNMEQYKILMKTVKL